MSRATKTMSISLPPKLLEEVDRMARQGMKTRSELFRDMIGVYRDYLDEKRWRRLRRLGTETAERMDLISEEDIERLVHEARGIRD